MLPAPKSEGPSLADVLKSSLAALRGEPNRLDLPRVDNAIVLLVDGLGADLLKARAGHARTLSSAPGKPIEAGFPTTTVAALASLTTGLTPGQHGLVGYNVLHPELDEIVNQLAGWDDRVDPATWQLAPTLFETAVAAGGVDAIVVAPERYRHSGFTRAVLRGARYVSAASIADRMHAAAAELKTPGAHLVYVYVPELDQAAHAHSTDSAEWVGALETTDSSVRDLAAALGPRDGLLVTADHGVLDVAQHAHVLLDGPILDGVRFIAGEPRCLQLHVEPGTDVAALADRWRDAEGHRAWVLTRSEAVEAGWFGDVRPEVLPRIGDILVAARKAIAYYDGRLAHPHGRAMIGQHGSWSPSELRVPLLRFGAFAR